MRWLGSFALALVLHGALVWIAMMAFEATRYDHVRPQDHPPAVVTMSVPLDKAGVEAARSEPSRDAGWAAGSAVQGAVAISTAAPLSPPTARMTSRRVPNTQASSVVDAGDALEGFLPPSQPMAAAALLQNAALPVASKSDQSRTDVPVGKNMQPAPAAHIPMANPPRPDVSVQSLTPLGSTVEEPDMVAQSPTATVGDAVAAKSVSGQPKPVMTAAIASPLTMPDTPPTVFTDPLTTVGRGAAEARLPKRRSDVGAYAPFEVMTQTAWNTALEQAVTEGTYTAIAALGISGAKRQDKARKTLEQTLNSIACARAQLIIDPQEGQLMLHGHVPASSDQPRLFAAVREVLGTGMTIRNNLRVLPSPQCSVLTAMDQTRLPQSAEQFRDPNVVGPDLHARVFAFQGGDALRLELVGAEYDGYLSLDYFDAGGGVLHLGPNRIIPDLKLAAEARLEFGGGGPLDIAAGKLAPMIGPPYGRDIVLAMITSEPIFSAQRPIEEEATVYMDSLSRRLSKLQAKPGFKGEWIYLFVETSADPLLGR